MGAYERQYCDHLDKQSQLHYRMEKKNDSKLVPTCNVAECLIVQIYLEYFVFIGNVNGLCC